LRRCMAGLSKDSHRAAPAIPLRRDDAVSYDPLAGRGRPTPIPLFDQNKADHPFVPTMPYAWPAPAAEVKAAVAGQVARSRVRGLFARAVRRTAAGARDRQTGSWGSLDRSEDGGTLGKTG
jgi:hypothetical protein